MITPELQSYVKGELGRGVSREAIRDSLLKNGWAAEDVEQVFTATAPSFVPPVAVAELEPGTQPMASRPDAKFHWSSKKTKILIAIVVLLFIAGGGAYAYYSGLFISSPQQLVFGSIKNVRNAKTVQYDTTVVMDWSELKDGLEGAASMFAGGLDVRELRLTAKGAYDHSDAKNFKNFLAISVAAGSMAVDAQVVIANQTLYGSLIQASGLGLFSVPESAENKWFSVPFGSEEGNTTDSTAVSWVGLDTSIMNKLTVAQKDHIYELSKNANFIKIVKKLPSETIMGDSSYHFIFDLDRAGIIAYLQSLKEYVNSVGANDSELSAFDPTTFGEGLDDLRDFVGEIWIGRADKLPRKISLSFGVQTDENKNEKVKVTSVSIFSAWNQPVSIEAPVESVPLEELMSEMMSGMLGPAEDNTSDVPDKKSKSN